MTSPYHLCVRVHDLRSPYALEPADRYVIIKNVNVYILISCRKQNYAAEARSFNVEATPRPLNLGS